MEQCGTLGCDACCALDTQAMECGRAMFTAWRMHNMRCNVTAGVMLKMWRENARCALTMKRHSEETLGFTTVEKEAPLGPTNVMLVCNTLLTQRLSKAAKKRAHALAVRISAQLGVGRSGAP